MSKVNQLFDRVGTSRIVDALRRAHPDAVREHEAVLEFRPAAVASAEPAPARDTAPTPRDPDETKRLLSVELARVRARKRKLTQVGGDTTEIDREILHLRRQLREGGQLHAGDALSDGRYVLIRRVGRGGFAVVWEARDEQRQERVAIKVLHSELAGDPVRRERFFRGARIMAELAHDAIVQVLEPHAEEGGFHYFVMELLAGGDLRDAVLAGRLGGEALLNAILHVGGALAKAHAGGLVHRDIKPANMLLDTSGTPRLTDFDLVGGAGTTGGTRTGAIGSWIYAAPELMHRPQDADARADVYGLGMTTAFGLHGADLTMDVLRDARGCAPLSAQGERDMDVFVRCRSAPFSLFDEGLERAAGSRRGYPPADLRANVASIRSPHRPDDQKGNRSGTQRAEPLACRYSAWHETLGHVAAVPTTPLLMST